MWALAADTGGMDFLFKDFADMNVVDVELVVFVLARFLLFFCLIRGVPNLCSIHSSVC